LHEGFRLEKECDYRLVHEPRAYLRPQDRVGFAERLDRPVYLKAVSFDLFTGSRWTVAFQREATLRDRDDGARDGMVNVGRGGAAPMTYTVYAPALPSGVLLGIPRVVSVELPSVTRYRNDVYVSPLFVKEALLSCRLSSLPAHWDTVKHAKSRPAAPGSHYTWLEPSDLSQRIRDQAKAWMDAARAGEATVEVLLRHFHEDFEYSLKVENPSGRDAVSNFLFDERRGYCELFATAFALTARAVGIPSRVSLGYCGGSYDPEHNIHTFFADDAHAWTEVCLEGHGWGVVDPTPPGSPHAPGPPEVGVRAEYPALEQAPDLGELIRRSGSRNLLAGMAGWSWPALLARSRPVMSWVFGFLLAVAGIGILAARGSSSDGRRRQPAEPGVSDTAGFFKVFCRHFARRGCRIRTGQTAHEYLAEIRSRGLANGQFRDLVDYFCAICYGRRERSAGLERELARRVRQHR
jgi:transglutaminase-like putative cysteine protease